MKKKLAAIAFAGMMAVGLTAGNVQAAEPSGEVYVIYCSQSCQCNGGYTKGL